MASSINASTTAGVVTTADTSGVLNIQTAGVTAISIDASQAVSFTNAPTVTGGTANGVAYLNGSKALTTGSALTWDGSNLATSISGSTSLQMTSSASQAFINLRSGAIAGYEPFIGFGDASAGNIGQMIGINGGGLRWTTGGTERMRLNSTGLGIATTNPVTKLQLGDSSSGQQKFRIHRGAGTDYTDYYSAVGSTIIDTVGGGSFILSFSGTERLQVDASGNLGIQLASAAAGVLDVEKAVAAEGEVYCIMRNNNGTKINSLVVNSVSTQSYNTAVAALWVGRASANGRGLNAGGTINASGADYAEYMTKAGNFTIAKGDVIGIDSQGKLTNVFANSVSFMVKSTDPSYVGGDSWGTPEALGLLVPEKPSQRQATEEVEAETDEEFAVRFAQYEADKNAFDAALEAARQRVDRIAFAGQVPVNVTGATAGQYIIPVNDNGAIKGEAVSNPTFEQYQIAVGKVIAIESDGRAKIIVKVA